MLQGALAPPYWYAFPAQRLGSISLCGGAKSTCAQPQNMSRGKNIRSPAPASCHVPWEVACGSLACVLSDWETCAPANEISTGTARIHTHSFITPPRSTGTKNLDFAYGQTEWQRPVEHMLDGASHCNPLMPKDVQRFPAAVPRSPIPGCGLKPQKEKDELYSGLPSRIHIPYRISSIHSTFMLVQNPLNCART